MKAIIIQNSGSSKTIHEVMIELDAQTRVLIEKDDGGHKEIYRGSNFISDVVCDRHRFHGTETVVNEAEVDLLTKPIKKKSRLKNQGEQGANCLVDNSQT